MPVAPTPGRGSPLTSRRTGDFVSDAGLVRCLHGSTRVGCEARSSWRRPWTRHVGLAVGAALTLSACTVTRIAHMGPLVGHDHLLTLVVSQDQNVVWTECGEPGWQPVFGCHVAGLASLPDGGSVKKVKIVRFTDVLPSEMALEIDAHELCHAVAALQSIEDPCHRGNSGILQSYTPPRARLRWSP